MGCKRGHSIPTAHVDTLVGEKRSDKGSICNDASSLPAWLKRRLAWPRGWMVVGWVAGRDKVRHYDMH